MTNTNTKDKTIAAPVIFAPASALGASGVSVIRISGSDISAVMQALSLRPPLPPRRALLRTLTDARSGRMIDTALVIYFPAPHSFTGEEVLELHTHGGMAIYDALHDCLSAVEHCRMAQAGEFSRRAFHHGKMDLLQAEAIADMIAAQTPAQHALALAQLSGELSGRYEQLREQAIRALALLEAYLDFPDEDIPDQTLAEVQTIATELHLNISALLARAAEGEMIRDGFCIALLGAPNAGKSSLLNALAQRDVAIVSPIAGTTRDILEVHLNLGGYLVRLVDTAGLRETEDMLEREGIRRALQAAKQAQLLLAICDATSEAEQPFLDMDLQPENCLIVWNKCDLKTPPDPELIPQMQSILISAKTGQGLSTLIDRLRSHIENRLQHHEPPALTRARHREALQEARKGLEAFELQQPLELACEQLRQIAFSIGKITGNISVDALLDVIFREFCIGK